MEAFKIFKYSKLFKQTKFAANIRLNCERLRIRNKARVYAFTALVQHDVQATAI